MPKYRILITHRAGNDLEEIHAHIAVDSPQNADAMVTRIMDRLELLAVFPHRVIFKHQSARLRYPVHSLPVPPYIVYFRILKDNKAIRILHVRHGARRPPKRF